MIDIELSPPQAVAGNPASYQSLWFLVRLWYAARFSPAPGWVRESDLRSRFAVAKHLRMLVSRAFADFDRWGVRVGWGSDAACPVATLPLVGRNRGPFWLVAGESARLRLLIGGRDAAIEEVASFLGLSVETPTVRRPAVGGTDFWFQWAAAKRAMLDGQLIVDGDRGALAGFRRATEVAADDYQHALAGLQVAMVWRRAGDADAARAVLGRLDRHWQVATQPEAAYVAAMAAVVHAWCDYARRDLTAAEETLRRAAADARWAPVFQHHPKVRGEQANLQALIAKARALDECLPLDVRRLAAERAVERFETALSVAFEAEYFDAAQSAATNLGWSIWLFHQAGVTAVAAGRETAGGGDIRARAWRWIALSEWLCSRYGVGGGAWNAIYLLRIARWCCLARGRQPLAEFRAAPIANPAEYRQAVAPVEVVGEWQGWRGLVAQRLEDIRARRLQVDPLQQANLLLEHAWYEAYEGDPAAAGSAVERLRRRLRELVAPDRKFFRDAIRGLPEEILPDAVA